MNSLKKSLYDPQQGGYREYGSQGGPTQGGYGYRGQQYGYSAIAPISETAGKAQDPYDGTYTTLPLHKQGIKLATLGRARIYFSR